MSKRKKIIAVKIRVGYEIPIGGEIRRYETEAEILLHGDTLAGLTQCVPALGKGLLDLADADRTTDWRNRPRFGGGGPGDAS